jgi:hypothetical protein
MSTSTNMVLNGNLSEFEELCVYYMVMLYVYTLYSNERSSISTKVRFVEFGYKQPGIQD